MCEAERLDNRGTDYRGGSDERHYPWHDSPATPFREDVRVLDRSLATKVFVRDGWECRNCRSSSGLHLHHVKFRSQQGTDEMDNLITLCNQCHRALHDNFLKYDAVTGTFKRLRGWKPK